MVYYANGLQLDPFLLTLTIVTIVTYVLSKFLNRTKASAWLAKLAGGNKSDLRRLDQLSKERRGIETERSRLSAQDNYAKWTKLNRKLDKLNDQITELSTQINSKQSTTTTAFSRVIMAVQKLPMLAIRFFYARTPVIFLLSSDFIQFPKPINFVLRLPFGKANTVSAFFWCLALETVLSTIHSFVADLKEYCQEGPEQTRINKPSVT